MAKKPSDKQRRAVLDTLANMGAAKPKSKKQILLEAGYSPGIAKNPQVIEESKGWQELMDEFLPDSYLVEKHRQLLDKMDGEQVDTQAVKAGLDLAYKAKRKIGSDQPQGGGDVTINIVSFNQYGGDTTSRVPAA